MNEIPTNKYIEIATGEDVFQGFMTHQGFFAKFINTDKDGFKNYELIQIDQSKVQWKELE